MTSAGAFTSFLKNRGRNTCNFLNFEHVNTCTKCDWQITCFPNVNAFKKKKKTEHCKTTNVNLNQKRKHMCKHGLKVRLANRNSEKMQKYFRNCQFLCILCCLDWHVFVVFVHVKKYRFTFSMKRWIFRFALFNMCYSINSHQECIFRLFFLAYFWSFISL